MTRAALMSPAFVLIWSSGYVVGSIASNAAPELAVTFWRLLVAGTILAGLACVRGARWPRDPRAIAGIALVGVLLFAVQFGGVYTGLANGMPAGTSALIVSSCPLLVAVIQAVVGAERLALRQWVGAVLGMAGVVVALLAHLTAPGSLVPLLWTVLGLAGFTAANVLTPRLVPIGVDARAVTSIECLAAAVVVLPWALLRGGIAVPPTAAAVGSGVWLTLINGVGGALILLLLVQTRGATRTSSLLFVVPAVTAIASWPVLGEPISIATLIGLAISGVGVALVQRSPAPRSHRDRPARLAPTMGS